MKTVYKYPLSPGTPTVVRMPEHATVLTVQTQNDSVSLWALVDTEHEEQDRRFAVYGTGHPIDPKLTLLYVGTFQLGFGALVFHVFEVLS